ncbi:homoserine dehydrogenase [Lentibacillus halodurans]|uniref:Homoserine dehydrogenase n=1 Tax=Lentibacillus halodurans TaxID=237679 RepID=A0A1I0Y1N5_9BACI|nr:homoserine dehydrogenase [Lentibacillus halodurans]SFB07074.1 homoserine dehydrogenase [Lentibacillus halodurans]
MEDKVSVGLLGVGVVGSGVISLIEKHQEKIAHQLGCHVHVKSALIRDPNKSRHVEADLDGTVFTTNADDVLNDPEIEVVVEVMGGIEEARESILKAFASKKHVVTANKDLVALYGAELHEAAERNKCDFYYEASVAGGIPILRGITDGFASDHIEQLMGIVNGTTNYILTKMHNEGVSYEDALKEAQELGFAEADPAADVDGLDAARKMAILCRLAFSTYIDLEDVEVTGINGIDLADLQYGDNLGFIMKLIGFAKFDDKQVEVNVQPAFISKQHPLADVKNEYNAVYVYGEAVGEAMFYGAGAGSMPTAAAVISDVVTVIKNMHRGVTGSQVVEPRFKKELKTEDQRFGQYYVRFHVKDEVGVFSRISSLFNQFHISFKQILQNPSKNPDTAEIVVITHQASLDKIHQALEALNNLGEVLNIRSFYKVEGDAEV